MEARLIWLFCLSLRTPSNGSLPGHHSGRSHRAVVRRGALVFQDVAAFHCGYARSMECTLPIAPKPEWRELMDSMAVTATQRVPLCRLPESSICGVFPNGTLPSLPMSNLLYTPLLHRVLSKVLYVILLLRAKSQYELLGSTRILKS